jgi:N-hydroxyarylamine O-acetyltransferase
MPLNGTRSRLLRSGVVQLSEKSDAPASAAWLASYLDVLGVGREQPSLAYLRKLNRAHVLRVPFENVTSILRRAAAGEGEVPPLDRDVELNAWAAQRGGGVCFEVVDMFGALLAGLGFRTHRVLAKISFVGSHQANIVDIDGSRYMVDAGNGAPFFEPIPIGGTTEISHAGLTYRFRAAEDQPDHVIQDRLIEGEWKPFCTYDLAPGTEAGRTEAFRRHHVRGGSWVVDNLTLIRCTDADVWSLRDNHLTHFAANRAKESRDLGSPEETRHVVAEIFGLASAPVLEAIEALRA